MVFAIALAIITFLAVWLVNALVSLLSGEHPRDTAGRWAEVFFGAFAILELGLIGRILSSVGIDNLPRKVVLFAVLLSVALFLLSDIRHRRKVDASVIQLPVMQTESSAVQP